MREPKDVILPNGKTLENELCEDRPNLHGADLHEADLHEADLRWADLHEANLHEADLRWANLRWANLHGANLYGADLYGANLHGANLYGANLRWADLRWANLRGADLRWANLHGANLYGADLHGADLHGAKNIISIGPIGSRADILYAVRWDIGVMVKTGCFWGTLEKFEDAVLKTHGEPADNRIADEYRHAIEFFRTWGKHA